MINNISVINTGRIILKVILSNLFNKPIADITDDFFLKIIPDYLKARSLNRYFEAFMDKYSKNFNNIIESSVDNIKPERLEFLISNIEFVFENYDFSIKNLIEKSFNTKEILEDIIQKLYPNRNSLSDNEFSQLHALLRVAVVFVVEASDKIQDFASQSTREILIRINSIQKELNRLIDDFDKNCSDIKYNRTIEMSSIEIEYKKVVRTLYSTINVFGANLSKEAKRYLLEDAYVTLNANEINQGYSKNIYDFLSERYLFVLGEAGTGKTTFINWLATNSAIGNSDLLNTSWDNKIPFVIELRKHNSEISFNTIRNLVSKSVPQDSTSKWVQEIFQSRRAMLLIDGMDEISYKKRCEVLNWLKTINDKYEINVVITSRPSAVYDMISTDIDEIFTVIELNPMSEDLISLFIHNWHDAVAKNYHWYSENAQKYSENIYYKIRNNRSLKALASYPLLCAMICGLWHNNGMILPKTKNEIYEECCKMLIQNRDESRHISHEVANVINQQQKFVIMDDVAYWMQINNYVSQKKKHVITRIENKIQFMSSDIKAIGAEKILNYLVERSGIIRNPSGSDIDFVHKTFQEYLAARVIMKNSDYGILIDKILDYNWHETILLAMGFASKADADEILSQLLDRGKVEKKYLYAAVACFDIPIELSPNIRKAVEAIIQEIIPPRNDHEARLLSSAPESIALYLRHQNTFSFAEAKLCINTLLTINTIDSFNVLAQYLYEAHDEIIQYILNKVKKVPVQVIAHSQLAMAIFENAVSKSDGVVVLDSFITCLCIETKYNIVHNCPLIKLLDTECWIYLECKKGLKACEWVVSSNNYSSLSEVDFSTISLENLIITIDDIKTVLPLRFLTKFNMLKKLTLNGVEDKLIDNLYAFSDIKGLEIIHFINEEFYFDNVIYEILSFFNKKCVTIEITAQNVYIGIVDTSKLKCIKKLIINDNSGVQTLEESDIYNFFNSKSYL